MAKKKKVDLPPQPKCTENGSHHWVIDTPNGPFSKGKCKVCNRTYDHFPNQSLTTAWSISGSA